jgi:hypothetical protein
LEKENIYDYIAGQLGAVKEANREVFTVYVPNKDRYGNVIANHKEWVNKIAHSMAATCGGCTLHDTKGIWHGNGAPVYEDTTIVYSYIMDDEKFLYSLDEIKTLLHEFGSQTNQQAVGFEFDSVFFTINFD